MCGAKRGMPEGVRQLLTGRKGTTPKGMLKTGFSGFQILLGL